LLLHDPISTPHRRYLKRMKVMPTQEAVSPIPMSSLQQGAAMILDLQKHRNIIRFVEFLEEIFEGARGDVFSQAGQFKHGSILMRDLRPNHRCF